MGPFIKTKNDTKKIMKNVLIALIPIILFSIYKNGYIPYLNNKITFIEIFKPLFNILVGIFTSFIIEFLYYKIIKKNDKYKYSYSIFPGLFLSLILPLKTPLYIIAIGASVSTLSKILFGGFGKNKLNPALVGYIFIFIAFSSILTTSNYLNNYELDTISSSTPLTNASLISDIGSYDKLIKPYGTLINFIVGTIPGSLAETSALLCIIAFIYLTITKTIKWRILVFYVATVFIITFGIGRLLGQGIYYPLFHIFSGGLLFGAVFMATDPVTSAVTPIGQILQGIFLGILTVVLRFNFVEGVAISIIISNLFIFLFDKIGSKARFSFIKCIPYYIVIAILIITSIIGLAATKRVENNQDPNFNIISKTKEGTTTNYIVKQKGYGGNIKAKIIIEDNKIKTIEILSHNETKDRYQLIIDNNYIQELIDSQSNIEQLDTVSNATVTSNALKRMINNVLQDYKH